MARIGLLVTLTAKLGHFDELFERVKLHAATTLQREHGCMMFDILVPIGSENEIRLVEIYLSEEALEKHKASPYLAAYREDSQAWVASREIVECELQVNRR